MLMAKALFPFLYTPLATKVWQGFISILAGTCGTILLVYFLNGLVSTDFMASLLGWIVGFNTALTGYMLMDKSGGGIPYWRWLCASAGLTNSAVSIVAINAIYFLTFDFPLVGMSDAGILLIIGAICGALGGLLSYKYLELKCKISR